MHTHDERLGKTVRERKHADRAPKKISVSATPPHEVTPLGESKRVIDDGSTSYLRKPYKVLARAVRLLRADYNSETILKALTLVTTTYVKNGKTDRRAHRAGLE